MNPALKKKLYHYAMVTLACAIMGIAMNTFYMPNKMLSGGIGGVAVLAYYVTVVRAKHVVDIKLESQAVLQKALVYRQVGVEHRLVDVMVFLVSLCDVSHHNGEHRPFRIEGVVEL